MRSRWQYLILLLSSIFVLLTFINSASSQSRFYPDARSGGNYMHNFYFPPSPSSTPWAPEWSPDGRWIGVAMQGSVWKVDPETGVAYEITYSSDAYHSSPTWSPDGRWIVFTADYDHQRIQLEILNVETGEISKLTDDQAIYTDPVFSPDGTKIAYISTNPNGYFNLYIRGIMDGRWVGEPIAVSVDNDFALIQPISPPFKDEEAVLNFIAVFSKPIKSICFFKNIFLIFGFSFKSWSI